MKLHSLATLARTRFSDCDDGTAHIWNARAKFAYTPMCEFCGMTSTEAQKKHPENGGVGPCEKRVWLMAWRWK